MVFTTSNHAKETLTSASNYMKEIVQKDKPPDRVELCHLMAQNNGSPRHV